MKLKFEIRNLRHQLRQLDFADVDERIEAARLRIKLGRVFNNCCDFDLALCSFRRGIHGLKTAAVHDVEIARAHTGIAISQWNLDGPGAALEDARLGLEKLPASNTKRVSDYRLTALTTLALCYFETGDMQSARQHYALGLEIATNIKRKNDVDTLKRRLALTYLEDGDCERAARILADAEPDHSTPVNDRLAWLNAKVLTCERLWQFREALQLYDQSLGIFETEAEPPWSMTAAITNAALLFVDLDQPDQLVRAEHILSKIPETELPLSVRLGKTRLKAAMATRRGAYDEALSCWTTMLDMVRQQAGGDPIKLRDILLELTQILLDQGRDNEAASVLQEQLAHDVPADALGIAPAKIGLEVQLSSVVLKNGQVDKALNSLFGLFAKILALNDHEIEYQFWVTLGDIKGHLSEPNVAIFLGKMAAEQIQRAAVGFKNSPADQQTLTKRHIAPLRRLTDLLIQAERFAEANQIQQIADHESTSILARGLRNIASPGSAIDFQTNERTLRNDVRRLQSNAQQNRSVSLTPQANQDLLARCRLTFQSQVNEAEDLFERISSGKWAVRNDPVPLPSPTNELHENEAVLRILTGDREFAVLLDRATGPARDPLILKRSQISDVIYNFWRGLSRTNHADKNAARQLYDSIIAPFEQEFEGVDHLKIVAPGPFSYLPFAALHDGENYLIERRVISYLPVSPVRNLKTPDGELSAPVGMGTTRPHGSLPALLFAQRELETLQRHIGAKTPLLDKDFTKAALATTLSARPSLLHIAAHFIAVPGSLYESHLALGEGQLPVADLLAERFQWEGLPLLVLSACSTAVRDAGDGVMQDLTTLLMQRGVRSVLSALWPICDMATSILMDKFYETMAAQTVLRPEQALAAAQRCMITGHPSQISDAQGGADKDSTSRGLVLGASKLDYSHPYYWAGFKYQIST